MSFWHSYADAHVRKLGTPKFGTHGIVSDNTSVDSLQSLQDAKDRWLPIVEKHQASADIAHAKTRVIQFGHFAGCPQKLRGTKSDTLLFFKDPRSKLQRHRFICLQLVYGNPKDVFADPCFEIVNVSRSWTSSKSHLDSIFLTNVAEADQGRVDTIVYKNHFDATQKPKYAGPKDSFVCLQANKYGLWKRPSHCPQVWSLHITQEASEMPKEKRCFVPHTKEWITDSASSFFAHKNSSFWEYFDQNPHGKCCQDVYNVRKESLKTPIDLPENLVQFLDEGLSLDTEESMSISKESIHEDAMETANDLSEVANDDLSLKDAKVISKPETVLQAETKLTPMPDLEPKLKKPRVESLLEKQALTDIQKQRRIMEKQPIFQNAHFATRLDLFHSAQVMIIEKIQKDDSKT